MASHNESVFLCPSSPVSMGFKVCSDQGLGLCTFYGSSRISESFPGTSAQLATQEKRKIVEVCVGDFRGHSWKCVFH